MPPSCCSGVENGNYVKKTTKSPQQCGIGLVKNRYQSLDLYLKINKYSKNPYKKLLS